MNNLDEDLPVGQSKTIEVLLDGKSYFLKIQNQKFNRQKYQDHVPIIRIMYGSCGFSDYLKKVFSATWEWLELQKNEKSRFPRVNEIPQSLKEYFSLFSTDKKNVFKAECTTVHDLAIYHRDFIDIVDEDLAELQLNYSHLDKTADLIEKKIVMKVRKLDRSLIDNLKELYCYQCQICRINFRDKYNEDIAEAHHIKPFIESYNNDTDNLMILCPNHHRLLHKANPKFIRNKLMFRYPNGFEEKLLLNRHLKN